MVIILCIASTRDGVSLLDSVDISCWIIAVNLVSLFLAHTCQILNMGRHRVALLILEYFQKKEKSLKDYLLRVAEAELGLPLREKQENLLNFGRQALLHLRKTHVIISSVRRLAVMPLTI